MKRSVIKELLRPFVKKIIQEGKMASADFYDASKKMWVQIVGYQDKSGKDIRVKTFKAVSDSPFKSGAWKEISSIEFDDEDEVKKYLNLLIKKYGLKKDNHSVFDYNRTKMKEVEQPKAKKSIEHRCSDCNMYFSTPEKLKAHRIVNHQNNSNVKEASTSSGAGPYQTPYAFSSGIDKKHHEIATQLGYKETGARADQEDKQQSGTNKNKMRNESIMKITEDSVDKEVAFLNKKIKILTDALLLISKYDKNSKYGDGSCPYGCDTPHIAKKALLDIAHVNKVG